MAITISITISITHHQLPSTPFCTFCDKKTFRFLKFFKSVFQKRQPINFQVPFVPFVLFVVKKIRFYPFNPFHPRSKSDNPSTSTNTLLCLLFQKTILNFTNPCSKIRNRIANYLVTNLLKNKQKKAKNYSLKSKKKVYFCTRKENESNIFLEKYFKKSLLERYKRVTFATRNGGEYLKFWASKKIYKNKSKKVCQIKRYDYFCTR